MSSLLQEPDQGVTIWRARLDEVDADYLKFWTFGKADAKVNRSQRPGRTQTGGRVPLFRCWKWPCATPTR